MCGGTSYEEDQAPKSKVHSEVEMLREEEHSVQGMFGRFLKESDPSKPR